MQGQSQASRLSGPLTAKRPRDYEDLQNVFFGMRDFALFKERDSEFEIEIKTRVRIGTESIHGMRDAENNHRDYEIARNLVRDYETEEPDWEPPNLTQSSKNSRGLGKNDHSR